MFQKVINKYRRYVSSKYKTCQIVFDGYKLTTKDHKHPRCEAYNPSCVDVLVNENVSVLHSREEFLSNSNNKQQQIKLLAKHFRGDGHTGIECEGDADTQVVAAPLVISCQKQEVFVVADDADILVCFCISGILKWVILFYSLCRKTKKTWFTSGMLLVI